MMNTLVVSSSFVFCVVGKYPVNSSEYELGRSIEYKIGIYKIHSLSPLLSPTFSCYFEWVGGEWVGVFCVFEVFES